MNQFFGSIWWLLVTLGLLITFHEYGHYVVARRCGVKVLRFSVGFGRPLWSRRDRHGTEFAIAAIPLGGYVKMLDEREGDVDPAEAGQAFNRKPVGQRMAIAAAGPAFNLIFTLVAFWAMFLIGKPDYQPVIGHVSAVAATAGFEAGERIRSINGEPVETWTDATLALLKAGLDRRDANVVLLTAGGAERQRTLPLSMLPADLPEEQLVARIGLVPRQLAVPATIGTIQPGSAAAAAGLQEGDRVLSLGGKPIADWREVPATMAAWAPDSGPLEIRVERNGDRLTVLAEPRANPDAAGSGPAWVLGIGPAAVEATPDALLRYGPLAAVPRALVETGRRTSETLGMLWRMVTGTASLKNLSGVITIAQVANSSAQLGPAWFLNFLAIISLSLAILNLLPIPVLDGGHLLYYLIEWVKGSPLSESAQVAGQYIGLGLLLALMGLAFYNDILRIAS